MSLTTLLTATSAGVVVGIVYSLSPMTVIFFAATALLIAAAGRGLRPSERRWVVGLLLAAAALRLIAIAVLFLATDPDREPFFTMFGDENLARLKALWLRNAAWGIPGAPKDFGAAYDAYGESGFVYFAAALQLLVGAAPYGLQLLNVMLFLATVITLHRVTRSEFGPEPAFVTLTILLFLPSLFVWSISALKEPSYYVLNALVIASTVRAIRARQWTTRLLASMAAVLLLWPINVVRAGAAAISGAGIVGGGVARVFSKRPRLLTAGALAIVLASWPIATRDSTQTYALTQVRQIAWHHWGHAATIGHGYRALDDELYLLGEQGPLTMSEEQAFRFVVRSITSFFTVPWPWQARSSSELLYLPQQMLWYVLLILATIGLSAGLHRHVVLTSVLASNVAVGAAILSLTNGNVGTLIRLRDMVTPMLAALAGLGACVVCQFAIRSREQAAEKQPLGHPDRASIPDADSWGMSARVRQAVTVIWNNSRTRALCSDSTICRLIGRGVECAVRFLSFGRSHDQAARDFSDAVPLVWRGFLIRAVTRPLLIVRAAAGLSRTGRTCDAVRRQWRHQGAAERLSLVGWTMVIGAGTHALLLGFSSSPPPLGHSLAAIGAVLGLMAALASRPITHAWESRRMSRG